jgi:hypothetical protein
MAKNTNPTPKVGQAWVDRDARKKREFIVREVHAKHVIVQTIDGKGIDGIAPKTKISMKRILDSKLYRPKLADIPFDEVDLGDETEQKAAAQVFDDVESSDDVVPDTKFESALNGDGPQP